MPLAHPKSHLVGKVSASHMHMEDVGHLKVLVELRVARSVSPVTLAVRERVLYGPQLLPLFAWAARNLSASCIFSCHRPSQSRVPLLLPLSRYLLLAFLSSIKCFGSLPVFCFLFCFFCKRY